MQKSTVLVSVLLPIKGGNQLFFSQSIQSILNQSYDNIELIIIDNRASKECVEIYNYFKAKDSRVSIVNARSATSLSQALNLGIECTSGQFVARQDADDISLPDRFSRQIHMFSNADIDLVGTSALVIDKDGYFLNSRICLSNSTSIFVELFFRNPFIHSSIMIRKSALGEAESTLR